MAKMKKFERVEQYLQTLCDQGTVGRNDLMKLHYRDLLGLPELEGIGDRTISNALKTFKKNLGVLPEQKEISKRQRVRNFLDEQMSSGQMTSEELMDLRYQDLIGRDPLKGIGKTTISCTLAAYKKNYEKDVFEDNILSFLDKEKASDHKKNNKVSGSRVFEPSEESIRFSSSELSVLRQMVSQFRENMIYLSEKKELELQELKMALRFSGIDSRRILELYWKSKKEMVFPMANLIQHLDSDLRILEKV